MTADGGMYVWGQGDGGWLGIPPPSNLPILGEGDLPIMTVTSSSSSCTSSSAHSVSLNSQSGVGSKDGNFVLSKQENIIHSCSFDSRHNVLVPLRINRYLSSSQYVVERVRCGGSHCIIFLSLKEGGNCQTEEADDKEYSYQTNNNNNNNNNNRDNSVRMTTNEKGQRVDSVVGSKRSPPRGKNSKNETHSQTMAEFLASSKT